MKSMNLSAVSTSAHKTLSLIQIRFIMPPMYASLVTTVSSDCVNYVGIYLPSVGQEKEISNVFTAAVAVSQP